MGVNDARAMGSDELWGDSGQIILKSVCDTIPTCTLYSMYWSWLWVPIMRSRREARVGRVIAACASYGKVLVFALICFVYAVILGSSICLRTIIFLVPAWENIPRRQYGFCGAYLLRSSMVDVEVDVGEHWGEHTG